MDAFYKKLNEIIFDDNKINASELYRIINDIDIKSETILNGQLVGIVLEDGRELEVIDD